MSKDWYGLYGEGWGSEIVPEAFSHPAKFSRGLIRRIYEHALEEGWLSEGDTVLHNLSCANHKDHKPPPYST